MKHMDKFIQKQMDIASQLYDLINQGGVTQRKLSKQSGVDEPTISEIMRGLANPTLETLVKLENALNKDLIIAPKFYKRDLEKDGYTIISPSLTNKLELTLEDFFKRTLFPRKGDKSEIKELELSGVSNKRFEISETKMKEVPEAA